MIEPRIKRALGQMMKGVQVVGAAHDGVERLYTSHWVCQISFERPIVLASVSPKHDTHALIAASGGFSVSMLAADQIVAGQYFSYPGRRFHNIAAELVESVAEWHGLPVVPDSIAWLCCEVQERLPLAERIAGADHELFIAEVTDVRTGRLKEPPLLYSSRLGWRATGGPAREPGVSIRDQLLERVAAAGFETGPSGDQDETEEA